MARLYANENFPRQVAIILRELGHDVLTVQEAGNATFELTGHNVECSSKETRTSAGLGYTLFNGSTGYLS